MIYIGIPSYDERHTVGPLLWRIREILYGERREFHVIVCDDGSDDGTRESLARYPRVLPMTLLRNESREGYGRSLERIVREAADRSGYPKRDALVTMQADFSDPPESLPELLRRFDGGADLVTLAPDRDPSRVRRLTRFGATLLAPSVRPPAEGIDPFASLRLYRLFTLVRALEETGDGPLIAGDGWAANAELLFRVWGHVRRAESVEAPAMGPRRYRESRFRALPEIRSLFRAARIPAVRAAARAASPPDDGEAA